MLAAIYVTPELNPVLPVPASGRCLPEVLGSSYRRAQPQARDSELLDQLVRWIAERHDDDLVTGLAEERGSAIQSNHPTATLPFNDIGFEPRRVIGVCNEDLLSSN
jgi:hypothetical protein